MNTRTTITLQSGDPLLHQRPGMPTCSKVVMQAKPRTPQGWVRLKLSIHQAPAQNADKARFELLLTLPQQDHDEILMLPAPSGGHISALLKLPSNVRDLAIARSGESLDWHVRHASIQEVSPQMAMAALLMARIRQHLRHPRALPRKLAWRLRQFARGGLPAIRQAFSDYSDAQLRSTAPLWTQEYSDNIQPRVCFISGCGGDSGRYRCAHALEAIRMAGGDGIVIELDDPRLATMRAELLSTFTVFVAQRAGDTAALRDLRRAAQMHAIPFLFETDDLVFAPDAQTTQRRAVTHFVGTSEVHAQFTTLRGCSGALCSTAFLQEKLQEHVRPVFLLRNAVSTAMQQAAEDALASRDECGVRNTPAEVILGYASGTPTHDHDFALIVPALIHVLETHANCVLHLVGHLQLDARLRPYRTRITHHAFVPWRQLPQLLATFDINLAPFEIDRAFCRGKSELKYIEAALVGVPTVASPLPAFTAAITHGTNGFLCEGHQAWERQLNALVENPDLRKNAGHLARIHVLEQYTTAARSATWLKIFASLGLPYSEKHEDAEDT